jgi:hypothetical protein
MENLDKKEGEKCEGCDKCGCCCGSMTRMHGFCGCRRGVYGLLKVILKIIIIMLIFACGFKLGVLVGSVRGGYDRVGGFGMMRVGDGNFTFSNTLPSLNSTTVTPAPKQ